MIIFFPPEGRISAPLHAVVDTLFGRTAFALPTGCALIGMLMLVRTLSPNVVLPGRRLVGLAILVVAVLVAEHVLAGADDGTGLVGAWLTSLFVDLLGPALTALVVLTALTLGTALVFGVRLTPRARRPSPHAES